MPTRWASGRSGIRSSSAAIRSPAARNPPPISRPTCCRSRCRSRTALPSPPPGCSSRRRSRRFSRCATSTAGSSRHSPVRQAGRSRASCCSGSPGRSPRPSRSCRSCCSRSPGSRARRARRALCCSPARSRSSCSPVTPSRCSTSLPSVLSGASSASAPSRGASAAGPLRSRSALAPSPQVSQRSSCSPSWLRCRTRPSTTCARSTFATPRRIGRWTRRSRCCAPTSSPSSTACRGASSPRSRSSSGYPAPAMPDRCSSCRRSSASSARADRCAGCSWRSASSAPPRAPGCRPSSACSIGCRSSRSRSTSGWSFSFPSASRSSRRSESTPGSAPSPPSGRVWRGSGRDSRSDLLPRSRSRSGAGGRRCSQAV